MRLSRKLIEERIYAAISEYNESANAQGLKPYNPEDGWNQIRRTPNDLPWHTVPLAVLYGKIDALRGLLD